MYVCAYSWKIESHVSRSELLAFVVFYVTEVPITRVEKYGLPPPRRYDVECNRVRFIRHPRRSFSTTANCFSLSFHDRP